MESFSLQGINLSSIPAAIMSYGKLNNNSNETTNPANACVNAINKCALEKNNTQKAIKQQLIELKREDEKQIDTMLIGGFHDFMDGKRALELAFETRIRLVKWTKGDLNTIREQTSNISTLIEKYEAQLKHGDTDYASKALKLLNNALEIEIPTHIVQDPIYQIHGSFHKLYDMYTRGGASNQLNGLGDNITAESLGLTNLGKNHKEVLSALDTAITSVDNVLKQIGDKYYGFFDKEIEDEPKATRAKSCDDIEQWLAYSIKHNELDNDRIGYTTMEVDGKKLRLRTNELLKLYYNKIDIYI